ncbi:serine hydrolase [Hyphococcus flavus]|uniref:Serine hydrolase n=1 Tax=Hyphococcus flavus TaxID=1866326 RepID=A0AAE9Z9Z1_9PROT|nr:serine hydrolase domain-containing protein [Hyphococcus flavus]WDI30203.1 serine hydrolase [Hyphococcus flavus]
MFFSKRMLLLFISIFELSGCSTIPIQGPRLDDAQRASLESALSESVSSGSVGLALGLLANSEGVVFEYAAGENAPGVAATTDTIVRLDSLTKPLTAAAVMLLVDQGKVLLADPVSKYIPSFSRSCVQSSKADKASSACVPVVREMTIAHLLTHTGGLAGYSEAVDALWDSESNMQFAEGIAKLPLRHQPGEGFQYGNAYEVLPAVISAASGMSFDAFLHQYLFNPMKMNDTYFVVPDSKRMRFAALYTRDDNGALTVMSSPYDPETETFPSGGGGVKSTLHDYARFARMLLGGGQLDGIRILSAEAVNLMTRPHVEKSVADSWQGDYAWGYGLSVRRTMLERPDDKKSVGSFGWNGGYGTLFFVDPSLDLIGITFTQMHWRDDHDMRARFEKAALAVWGQR